MPTPVSALDYDLPRELIAQEPLPRRDASRLLVLRRSDSSIEHRAFRDVLEYLAPGDVLVLNDTRVFPARIFGVRTMTSGKVEGLLVERLRDNTWQMMLRSGGKLRQGERIAFGPARVEAALRRKLDDGTWHVDFRGVDPLDLARDHGLPPVPPYIRRTQEDERAKSVDAERYQTVYARELGAVAAPTAGLHFTRDLLAAVARKDVEVLSVTLHVGLGTFLPVKTPTLEEHPMHAEPFHVSADVCRRLASAARERRRIVAVGTTVARVLESLPAIAPSPAQADLPLPLPPAGVSGRTDLFIYPPCRFRLVGALLTNFHLPRSTLLALVAAFAGLDLVLSAYREAIARRYRFYSYGDAMLIL
ncbi:MAG: tRNA preQ1(34) S-adenosylmethionine ribosyltransferase-isomerase QueA [Planctomycetota bacterium]